MLLQEPADLGSYVRWHAASRIPSAAESDSRLDRSPHGGARMERCCCSSTASKRRRSCSTASASLRTCSALVLAQFGALSQPVSR